MVLWEGERGCMEQVMDSKYGSMGGAWTVYHCYEWALWGETLEIYKMGIGKFLTFYNFGSRRWDKN